MNLKFRRIETKHRRPASAEADRCDTLINQLKGGVEVQDPLENYQIANRVTSPHSVFSVLADAVIFAGIMTNYFKLLRNCCGVLLFTISGCGSPGIQQQYKPDMSAEPITVGNTEFYPVSHKPEYSYRSLFPEFDIRNDSLILLFKNTDFSGEIAVASEFKGLFNSAKRYPVKSGKAVLPMNVAIETAEKAGTRSEYFTLHFGLYDEDRLITVHRQSFSIATFQRVNTITRGPRVISAADRSVELAYETAVPEKTVIRINGIDHSMEDFTHNHRITIDALRPDNIYSYTVVLSDAEFDFQFKTAPAASSDREVKFLFAGAAVPAGITSEDKIHGTDARKIRAVTDAAGNEKTDFILFAGNVISGTGYSPGEVMLHYHNYNAAVADYAQLKPVYTAAGKGEFVRETYVSKKGKSFSINRIPALRESSEALFERGTAAPMNGPHKEQGDDLPLYRGNVFKFEYGNTAVIVLNTEYHRSDDPAVARMTGRNISGYIGDAQLKWLQMVLDRAEKNETIKHAVICMHSPPFPIGEYSGSAMWYGGRNVKSGIFKDKTAPGIIERRDAFLDLCINRSSKVKMLLTGEPGYTGVLKINDDLPRYPENYSEKKIELNREIEMINNGSLIPSKEEPKSTLPWRDRFTELRSTPHYVMIMCGDKKFRYMFREGQ